MTTTSTGITVTGTGTAAAAPDTTQLRLAAEHGASSVQDAIERAAAAVAAMRSSLLEHGVEAKDLRSTDASVHPDHDRGGGPRGYRARIGLTATVRQVDVSGEIAQAALAAGGNAARMDALSFAHSDPAALHTTAREAAFADARAKADQLAQLAGQELGVIEEIAEGAGGGFPGGPRPMLARAMAEDSLAFDAGEQEVSVSVTIRWAWA